MFPNAYTKCELLIPHIETKVSSSQLMQFLIFPQQHLLAQQAHPMRLEKCFQDQKS
jgi:hypothetical protein